MRVILDFSPILLFGGRYALGGMRCSFEHMHCAVANEHKRVSEQVCL